MNRIMEKTLMCENIGVHLVHVYQDEWADEQGGVRATIRNILKNVYPSGGDIIVLPRGKYPAFYDIPGYRLDSVTEPSLVVRRYKNNSHTYTLYNCGSLIYKKIGFAC